MAQYGEPINCSSNGLYYIFKNQTNIGPGKSMKNHDQHLINQRMTFSVMMLTVFGIVHLKTINIYENIKNYFEK